MYTPPVMPVTRAPKPSAALAPSLIQRLAALARAQRAHPTLMPDETGLDTGRMVFSNAGTQPVYQDQLPTRSFTPGAPGAYGGVQGAPQPDRTFTPFPEAPLQDAPSGLPEPYATAGGDEAAAAADALRRMNPTMRPDPVGGINPAMIQQVLDSIRQVGGAKPSAGFAAPDPHMGDPRYGHMEHVGGPMGPDQWVSNEPYVQHEFARASNVNMLRNVARARQVALAMKHLRRLRPAR